MPRSLSTTGSTPATSASPTRPTATAGSIATACCSPASWRITSSKPALACRTKHSAWLRKSADVMLQHMHADGAGFEYGRSLGPYSETAIIEVLTAAARVGLLTGDERALAYAYASRAAQRYVDFWISKDTGSVNLWDDGRRTDDYRGKFRILGENLSLVASVRVHQRSLERDGLQGSAADGRLRRGAGAAAGSDGHLVREGHLRSRCSSPAATPVTSSRFRLINGGASQHMHHPYFPIPFSRGMLEGVADGTKPMLVPQFTLNDGAVLMPLAFIRDAKVDVRGSTTTVTYRQSQMDRMGGAAAGRRRSTVGHHHLHPGTEPPDATGCVRAEAAARHHSDPNGIRQLFNRCEDLRHHDDIWRRGRHIVSHERTGQLPGQGSEPRARLRVRHRGDDIARGLLERIVDDDGAADSHLVDFVSLTRRRGSCPPLRSLRPTLLSRLLVRGFLGL